jgi:hypothetical protein
MKTTLLKSTLIAGLFMLSAVQLQAFTAVTSGTWSNPVTWGGLAPGGTVVNQDIIIPSGISVDLDMDVSFSAVIDSFLVNGTLHNTSNHSVTISLGTFAGNGTVNIDKLILSGAVTTTPFSGTLTVNVLRNMGAAITTTAVISIGDSLSLESGSFILSTGSNLMMMSASNLLINAGTFTSTGGLFTTTNPYSVWYTGLSKSAGLEVNSTMLQSMHINLSDNTQIITLGQLTTTINGTLYLATGQLSLNGNTLILDGNLSMASGTLIQSTNSSNLEINGTGNLTSPLAFGAGSLIGDVDINRTGGTVTLASALTVTGALDLAAGTFTVGNGGTLTMSANSTVEIEDGALTLSGGTFDGTSSYNVIYDGGTVATNIELSGSGLSSVTVNLNTGADMVQLSDNTTIGGTFNMQNGMFSLEGSDLTLTGTLNQNAASRFKGNGSSNLTLALSSSINDTIWFDASGQLLNKLTLNLPAASTITLGSALSIDTELDLTSGKLAITSGDLTLTAAASVTNFNEINYVATTGSGSLEMMVNMNSTYVTFPVGTLASYSPARLQQTSAATSGMFRVRVMDGVYTGGTTGFNMASTESVVDRTWLIETDNSVTVNMNLRLGWMISEEVNGFNRGQSYITHYMNGNWDSDVAAGAVAGPSNTYELTRTGIMALSPFAVADTSALIGVEENNLAASLTVYPNPATTQLNIVVNNDKHATYKYELFDATGNLVLAFENSDASNRVDVTALSAGYYFLKITETGSTIYVTKEFIKP